MRMKKIKAMLAACMMLAALAAGTALPASAAETSGYEGIYAIRNVNSGKFLNVAGGVAAAGTNIQQWSSDAAHAYDTWHVVRDTDGAYHIYSMLGDGATWALASETNGNIALAKASSADTQRFDLAGNADGSFHLVEVASGKTVEIINAETDSGANVQLWEINGATCQNWELIPVMWDADDKETPCTVSGDSFTPGDLNDDGSVDVMDMGLAKRLLVQGGGTDHVKHAANVDGKTGVTVSDFIALHKFVHTGEGGFIREDVPMERVYAAVDGSFEKAYVETTNEGFTQSAYLNLYNEVGADMSFNVDVPSAGIYALKVRFANGGAAARGASIEVNGSLYRYALTGEATGAWTTWQEETVNIALHAGLNKIVITSLTADGAANLDSLTISDTTEAESPKTAIPPIKATPSGGAKNQKGVGMQMEYLNRGVSAAYTGSGLLVSWRLLATDDETTNFKIYKNGEFVADVAAGAATNYFISGAAPTDSITVDTYVGRTMTEQANKATMFGTKNSGVSGAYFDINTQRPADQTMPDGTTCSYTENDCSVGDIDGDGQYEIFVKWDPSNSKDNSNDGYTGTTFIDCYRLDGTLVWRIDLGKNIRSGAHYTQYLVYDFDGDGKCELICKTADGTKDGKGSVIGDASKDYRSTYYRASKKTYVQGKILEGPEYLTLFDGMTGAALDTVDYDPARGDITQWGDDYGNRVDRFTACVAYLDGEHASACFGRGYYTRLAMAAWDVKNGKLSKRWVFDTGFNVSAAGYGDGNHHCLGADVDGDGKQEVVCGSAVIDDSGKLLYTTSNAHGDAVHIGDFDPTHPGIEIFQCLEDEKHPNGKAINFGVELRDAATGAPLFRETAGGDTGRCIADNLIAGNAGAEMAGSHNSVLYDCVTGKQMKDASGNDMTFASITKWGQNSVVYWTDVLERAVLDRTMADQYGKGRVFTGDGVTYNNASKSNACLTCDLMGDWREEMIFRKSDGGLRVFTTTYSTEYPIYTLMHNAQYRVQVAAQNNGYNQPPHTDYFLGTGFPLPEVPTVYDYKAN